MILWSIHYWPMAQPCWLSFPWVPVVLADTSDSLVKSSSRCLSMWSSCIFRILWTSSLPLSLLNHFHVVYQTCLKSVWVNSAMWFGSTASFLLKPSVPDICPRCGASGHIYLPLSSCLMPVGPGLWSISSFKFPPLFQVILNWFIIPFF